MKAIEIIKGKDLYIRLPKELEDKSVLTLVLPKELAGKTLKIVPKDSQHTPFERDAISKDDNKKILRYYGEDFYWKPQKISRIVVKANPKCDYETCTCECNMVSCPVHQGFASDEPMKVEYIQSNKMK